MHTFRTCYILLWLDIARWWRHQMKTFSSLLALYEGNPSVTGGFPSQRPVTRSFVVFFDLHLNKRLSKQSISRWFETPSCSLWRHCNGIRVIIDNISTTIASSDVKNLMIPYSKLYKSKVKCSGLTALSNIPFCSYSSWLHFGAAYADSFSVLNKIKKTLQVWAQTRFYFNSFIL